MAKMENVSISFKYVIHFEFIALLVYFWSKFKPFLSHIVTGKAPPQKRFALHPNQILLGKMSQLTAASAELLSQAYKFENNLSLQNNKCAHSSVPRSLWSS